MTESSAHEAIAAVWRAECAKVVAVAARLTRDVGVAEECAQDALVAALEHWPSSGVPDNPAAWLTTVAKRRALDRLRHAQIAERTHEALGRDLQALDAASVPDFVDDLDAQRAAASGDDIADDVLRLMFIACHPVVPPDARVALTLRLVGGLTTPEIARAFLVPEPTVAQRIVRAKKTLSAARVPFEMPVGGAREARLGSVLEVIYVIFNEGYTATEGEQWMRPELCNEALRLGRLLARLASGEAEVHGLLALMEFQASRSAARVDLFGHPILLPEQNRALWDRAMIERGSRALSLAESMCDSTRRSPGPYILQAALAACHATASAASETDWARIAALYERLGRIAPSPIVELNRGVAIGMAFGPAAGLEIVDALLDEPKLKGYHWLPSVRGDLLAKLGRRAQARTEFLSAAAMTANAREQALLIARADALAKPDD